MRKVRTMEEAYRVFELLGIKEVTKEWQRKKGTEVWELPFKTMYYNGHAEVNRFSIYRNGYVRKMIVGGENNASRSCYQLNRVCKVENEYYKEYEWSERFQESLWTGKYLKSNRMKRIMIKNYSERLAYLCNYILKNYYNNKKLALVGKYTMLRVSEIHGKFWRQEMSQEEAHYANPVHPEPEDVQVIINGHRYNLS